jgi:hypothetical protein
LLSASVVLTIARIGSEKTRVVQLVVAPGVPPGRAVIGVARSGVDGDAAEGIASGDAENILRARPNRPHRSYKRTGFDGLHSKANCGLHH